MEWSREKLDLALEEQKRFWTTKKKFKALSLTDSNEADPEYPEPEPQPEPPVSPSRGSRSADKLAGALMLNRVKNRFRAARGSQRGSTTSQSAASEIKPLVLEESLPSTPPESSNFAGVAGPPNKSALTTLFAAAAQEPAVSAS